MYKVNARSRLHIYKNTTDSPLEFFYGWGGGGGSRVATPTSVVLLFQPWVAICDLVIVKYLGHTHFHSIHGQFSAITVEPQSRPSSNTGSLLPS